FGFAAESGNGFSSEEACGIQYGMFLHDYLNLSGIETRWEPQEHREFKVRSEVELSRRNWAWNKERPETELGYIEMLVYQARTYLAACWAHGGRFWESEVHLADYIGNMSGDVADALFDLVIPRMKDLTTHNYLRFAMCVPAMCDSTAIRRLLIPRFLGAHLAGWDIAGQDFFLPAPSPEHAIPEELTDWANLSLDFVIAGTQRCGTASLWQNLGRHPEIGFIHGMEEDTDYFFANGVQRRMLPLKSQVVEFNGRWAASGQQRPALVGLRHVKILQYPLARLLAAQVPRLVPIVVLCDPVGRAEKEFLQECVKDENKSELVELGKKEACRQNIVDFFGTPPSWGGWGQEARDAFWRSIFVREDIAEMQRLFGRRLLAFHQDRYREDERGLFAFLAKALGATLPFPPEMDFGHYNSVRGERSDLCRNRTLVQHLKNFFQNEFQAQAHHLALAGERVPESLALGLGRCDRAGDARGRLQECDQHTKCNF
ncbi:unnamed protein product, partial [Polarella glacialis]